MTAFICVLVLISYNDKTVNAFQLTSTSTMKQSSIIMKNELLKSTKISKSVIINVAALGFFSAVSFAPFIYTGILRADAAQTYLKEPTSDFKEEEIRTAEKRKSDLAIRKSWDEIVEQIKASEKPETTAAAIKKLNVLLAKVETIPTGVKKLDIVKTCRAKKFEGKKIRKTWTKDVEIEYEAMIQQFNRQFNPKNPGDKTI